ncbi:MAG TPA: hypothetical protein VNI20_00240, partial [Fimbriimonadaceae bacterium]|nr:hypothetical protein [Fimbriimonadaceae bacterium]
SLHLPLYAPERAPNTPPTSAMRAFRQALVEFESGGGLPTRHEKYSRQAKMIRSGLSDLGFSFFTPTADASSTVTVATVPKGFTAESWLSPNYEAGYALFECKGDLRDGWFQVSTMGEVTDEMVEAWLVLVKRLLGR